MTSLRAAQQAAARRALFGDALIQVAARPPAGSDDDDYDSPPAVPAHRIADPAIPGVVLRPLTVHRDPRGTLTELLRADWPDVFGEAMPFAQMYASVTAPGIARDEDRWHLHERQTDRFVVLAGRIVVAVADARPDSPAHGTLRLIDFRADRDAPAPALLTVPSGVLHGLLALGDGPAVLLNAPTRLFDPDAPDERRVPFADAAITLPSGQPFAWEIVRQALG